MEIAYLSALDDMPLDETLGERPGKERSGDPEGRWLRRRIDESGLIVSRGADSTIQIAPAGSHQDEATDERPEYLATLLACGERGRDAVLLLPGRASDSPLLVNGFPPLSVTELPEGTEISLGPESLFCHAAGLREIEIFAGCDEICPRCKRALEPGDAIRRCSHCESPHHEGRAANSDLPELRCASYDPVCAHCRAPWPTTPPNHEEVIHVD